MKLTVRIVDGIEGSGNCVLREQDVSFSDGHCFGWEDCGETVEGVHVYRVDTDKDGVVFNRQSEITVAKQRWWETTAGLLLHELVHFAVAFVFGRNEQNHDKMQRRAEVVMNRVGGFAKAVRGIEWK